MPPLLLGQLPDWDKLIVAVDIFGQLSNEGPPLNPQYDSAVMVRGFFRGSEKLGTHDAERR